MVSPVRKFMDALKLYKTGIFRIYFNKLLPHTLCFHTFYLYDFNLKGQELFAPFQEEPLAIIKVKSAEDDLFKKFRKKFPADEFLHRINQDNQECYIALINNEIAAYAWLAYRELYLDTVNFNYPMKDDELFIYACFVPKKFRGRGIYPAVLQKMLVDSRNNSYNRALIGVSSANTGSKRGIVKAGFKYFKKINYLKLGKKELWKGLEDPKIIAPSSMVANP